MYNKGLMVNKNAEGNQIAMVVGVSLTSQEINALRDEEGSMESELLSSLSKQVKNTREYAESQTEEPQSFAKGMNQSEGGAIVILSLTDSDIKGLEYEVEDVENNILDIITKQARSARHRGFNRDNKSNRRQRHQGSDRVRDKNEAKADAVSSASLIVEEVDSD